MNKLDLELGKAAYDAYCSQREWKSVKGEPLPFFESQNPELIQAWCKAAQAAIQKFLKGVKTE